MVKKRARVAVVGSINMDSVSVVPHLPRAGETVTSRSFLQYPGGKGANQAVAAARMGGDVALFGKVGADPVGKQLLAHLRRERMRTEGVESVDGLPTGTASIFVSDDGENVIAYTPGANAAITNSYVNRVLPRIADVDVLLLQLEIPISAVRSLLSGLPPGRPLVILDPAPSEDLSGLPLSRVDIITPNRGELLALTGIDDMHAAAESLLSEGIDAVVCTMGADGSWLIEDEREKRFEAFGTDVLDTTAAGDAFAGTLSVQLACEFTLDEAIRTANAAGALAVSRRGAQTSLPTQEEVAQFLKERGG